MTLVVVGDVFRRKFTVGADTFEIARELSAIVKKCINTWSCF